MHRYNKFLIICVSLAVALLIFSTVFLVMGRANLLSEVGSAMLYPFEWMFQSAKGAFDGFAAHFALVGDLINENESLRAEKEELESRLTDADALKEENDRLFGYLELKELYRDFSLCQASVISMETTTGDGAVSLKLNVGSSAGIEVNMPVVTNKGLVGYVSDVGSEWCRVKTLINTSAVVSIAASDGSYTGMSGGEYSLVEKKQFKIKEILPDADIAEGDIIVTRGDGLLYPSGVPLGRVVAFEKNEYSRTKEAVIEPFADMTFSKNINVMIVTDFEVRPMDTGVETDAVVEG